MEFCLEFQDHQQNINSIDYVLKENDFSHRWFNKLKKIYRVPPSIGDSNLDCSIDRSPSRVNELLEKVCHLIGVEFKKIDITKQQDLNLTHQNFFENLHQIFSEKRLDFNLLYRFHLEIHRTENLLSGKTYNTTINIGWAEKEGLLMEKYPVQSHYSKEGLKAGCLYNFWSELGKHPTAYFKDKEPNDQSRFNTLSKPNLHHRAKFGIAITNCPIKPFSQNFIDWFALYKEEWLKHYKLNDWQPYDEQSGVLLAEPKISKDYESFFKLYTKFYRIVL